METGVIVDVETTGLNPETDKIIEIALIEFVWDGHDAPQITRTYSAVQDPGIVILPEIVKLTGLTPNILAVAQSTGRSS